MKSAVVLCSDARLMSYACCAFLAISRNIDARHTELILVAVDAGDEELARAHQFFAQRALTVRVIRHDQTIYFDQSLGDNGPATVTRLELDGILPNDLDRVLYLDVDTLVMENLTPLLEVDLEGFPAAAVEREFTRGPDAMNDYMRMIGMKNVSYFNAGVILFNWKKTLSSGLLHKAREALRGPTKLKNSDQCALNIAIDGAFLKLNARWNARPIHLGTIPNVAIAHFVGPQKPWHRSVPYYFLRYRDFYHSALQDSPWAAKIERETALETVVQKLKDLVIYVTRRQRIKRLERIYGRQSASTLAQR